MTTMTTVLTPGQQIPLTTDDGRPITRLRIGLGWDAVPNAGIARSGALDVDLDASALQFAGSELFDLAFYNNLRTRDGSVVHQGDNLTGHGEGDDETLTVDLSSVYPKVDTIVLLVSSYQGHALTWVNRSYCRLVDDADDTETARLTLTHGVEETGLAMAKLVRETDATGWRLHALGEGIAIRRPSESWQRLRRFL